MAALSIQDRTRIWRGVMRYWSNNRVPVAIGKRELYNPDTDTGVIAKMDDWVDTHSGNTAPDTVGLNGSLSVAERAALTATQKGELLIAIAAVRVDVELARRIFGEVG